MCHKWNNLWTALYKHHQLLLLHVIWTPLESIQFPQQRKKLRTGILGTLYFINSYKFLFKPSGLHSRHLNSGCSTWSNYTHPYIWDASPLRGYPQYFICQYSFIHLSGDRHCKSNVSCPSIQYGDRSQGSNATWTTRSGVWCSNH